MDLKTSNQMNLCLCVAYTPENDKGWETWGSDKHGTPFTSKNEAIKEARKLGIQICMMVSCDLRD